MAFTNEEKVKIRHHLGFLNVAEVMTYVLGAPAGVETQFLIEGAMNRVLLSAEPEVRRHVQILDGIEGQLVSDLELLAITKIGEIDVRQDEMKALRREYQFWQASLANLLGISPNPWDRRFALNRVNAPVAS